MKIKSFLSLILFFVSITLYCQLSLQVEELKYDAFTPYVPKNDFVDHIEFKYRGHIFEISIFNNSEKPISLPLDTLSYVLPYAENTKLYYKGEDFIRDPDLFNVLGVYPFLYQKNKFIDKEFDMSHHLEILPKTNQTEIDKLKTERLIKIKEWKEKNKLGSDLHSIYNWYILKSMITIAPKTTIKYKIYFNPFLKRQDLFDYHEFYWRLNPDIPYKATFKLILNKNLYKYLSKGDKKKYVNLFIGVITSESMNISTNPKK
ncbi:hypothetical protein AB670_01333 [Chryseobacterium sp. MOF25P]|uniref:hypothetical protein n=1 Tax=unclassified Chryseobacterium TaxID=2593645 RepID=UPI0008054800|nr:MULTISPECIES: hypothetical protein [unclassified Chryseobacterium]OBW42267.1 hypothetical protein AB670_01333 [Chryseobacterium sp. MOF25P]OBW46820.1 hypothetical protein AB671_01070 [Chryseobacterium sp. BGARF1]